MKMDKELEALEAFYEIKDKLIKVEGNTTYGSIIDLTNLNIIEAALKRLDKIDNILAKYNVLNEYHLEEKLELVKRLNDDKTIEIVNKERFDRTLKALEIIKEKKVNVNCIISGWSLWKYNSYKTHINLTQEEYDLLRWALL